MKGGNLSGHVPWAAGNGVVDIVVEFTTDSSGNATLVHDYKGGISISKNSNTYTVTLPKWGKTYGFFTKNSSGTLTFTESATAGTLTFAFAGAFNSGRAGVFLRGSTEPNG